MQVRRCHYLLRLIVTAATALLATSCAPCLSSYIVTPYHRFLFPDSRSLLGRCGTSLALLDLSDQAVHLPGRTSITLPAAQAYQPCHFLVRPRRRIQLQREDWQAIASRSTGNHPG